ncbi:MAG TPA: beta-galactosidase [bacterium]|nr:beta-galactosidase [bacterium]HPP29792.1 beta-galactosidase [bacterium]
MKKTRVLRSGLAIFTFILFILFLSTTAFTAGTVKEYSYTVSDGYRYSNERFNNYPCSLYGPRIEWAQPFALGKLKLLIIIPWGSCYEVPELCSRIPAEVNLITTASSGKWVNPGSGEPAYEPVPVDGVALNDTAHRLLSAGYKYDAIIIAKVKWSIIPPVIQDKILAKVKAGTALVWISPWDVNDELQKQMALTTDSTLLGIIQSKVPLEILPLDVDFEQTAPKSYFPRRIGPPDIRTGKLGGGRIVWLDYKDRAVKHESLTVANVTPWLYYAEGALTPYLPDDNLYYDYYYSILGKVLYYAAGKTTPAQLSARQQVVKIKRQELPGSPVSFHLTLSSQEVKDLSLIYELRDRNNYVIKKGERDNVSLSSGQTVFSPPLPLLTQGLYVVDIWVLQRGLVLDWASSGLIVTDTKYIESVQMEKEFFAPNDHIRGTVKFAVEPEKNLSVSAELWDTYNRLVAVKNIDRGDGFDFSPIAYPLSRTYRIVVQIKEKDFVVDSAEKWFGIPSSRVDDYQFIMWANGIKTRSGRITMYQCKKYGVTGYYDGCLYYPQREQIFESADNLAQNNLLANPYSIHAVLRITPQEPFHKTVNGLIEWLKRRLDAYRKYGTMAYSTCEECYIDKNQGAWENPEALKDYHNYLKERYGTIAKLNDIWGSNFQNFDEIQFITFMEAKTTGQPTRWLEQELHRVERFNSMYELIYQAIQNDDPGARMSLDCIGGMDFDWPRMAKITRCYTQAPLEFFNKDKKNLVGTFIGYYFGAMDEWTMRITPWQYLFQGGTHIHWWPVSYAFTADRSEPMLCFKQAAEECRELEGGTGKLLISSKKRVDPILLLWSNNSYYASTVYPGEIRWENARASFENMLRHTGLDYQAVGEDFIETSLSYGENQRVLILPACQSISRRGVEKIKEFVAAGGLVIADFPPAVVDEYLRPYGDKKADSKIEFEVCPKCKGEKRIYAGGAGNVLQTCPLCGGTGQVVKGGTVPSSSMLDALFDFNEQGVKKFGKGYGLYLKGSPNRREEWGAIRRILIEKGGVRGDIEVNDIYGNLRTDVRSYVFDNGNILFLGILPDRTINNPPGESITIKLGNKMHVYDVRLHKYLGETDRVQTGILPSEAKLLAFLPARIDCLNLSLSKYTARPGDVIEVKGSLAPASLKSSTMVARIEVSLNGEIQDAYTKNLDFQGNFTYPIPLALNQQRGEYIVKVMELVSGYTQELKFNVK